MDAADLLDYALGRLHGPRRERLERLLAGDPALAARVARLARNLGRLLDDGRGPCPVPDASAPIPRRESDRDP
jgi:anti-sigma factor RsiW